MRLLGREALRGRWGMGIMAFLLYFLTLNVPAVVLMFIPAGTVMVTVYTLLVTGPLALGISIFSLNVFRNEEPAASQVFHGFEKFRKAFLLSLVIGLLIMLRLLLIIPGVILSVFVPFLAPLTIALCIPAIIAALKYSQAFFILVDNPEFGVMECITKSKELMGGNKAKYFLLNLSFIGWALLAAIPVGIYVSMVSLNAQHLIVMEMYEEFSLVFSSPGFIAIATVLSIGTVVVEAYMTVTMAGFYEMLKGNLKPGYIPTTASVVDEV